MSEQSTICIPNEDKALMAELALMFLGLLLQFKHWSAAIACLCLVIYLQMVITN